MCIQHSKALLFILLLMRATVFGSTTPSRSSNDFASEDMSEYDKANKIAVSDLFKRYNPNIKNETVDLFMKITSQYDLTEEVVFKDCAKQLCLESKVRQSAISPTGAIGVGQITATTAFHTLHNISKEDWKKMKALGADDIEWAKRGKYSHRILEDGTKRFFINDQLRSQAVAWLSVEKNNLIFWGHFISVRIHRLGRNKAFLSYRLGDGGARLYAGKPEKHPYVVGLRKIKFAK